MDNACKADGPPEMKCMTDAPQAPGDVSHKKRGPSHNTEEESKATIAELSWDKKDNPDDHTGALNVVHPRPLAPVLFLFLYLILQKCIHKTSEP